MRGQKIHLQQPEAQRKPYKLQKDNLKWGIADMANRRMFSLDVVDTDVFLDLPISSQALYFHLGMRADDDGFVSSPKRVTSMIGANQDDLKLLIAKGFIIALEDGIIVIRHWKQNNYIQNDRRKSTIYQSQLAALTVNNGIYEVDTQCIQTVSTLDTQDSIDKNSKDKGSKGKDNIKASKHTKAYFPNDESLNQAFVDYLEMRKQIKKPMTERAVELAIKKLEGLSVLPFSDSMDNDLAIQILNQSVMNSWQGLFPLKEQKTGSTPKGGVDWSKV
jgi:hypothetical protein